LAPAEAAHGLSKSRLISSLQCERRLWLEVHRPDRAETSATKEAVFALGNEVGDVARRIYGADGGHLVPYDPGLTQAVAETRRLLAAGQTDPIFEATFAHRGVLVRVDVLLRESGRYRPVEVKASTSVKDVHIDDCAIQKWVLEHEGLDLSGISLARVDSSFVYAGDGRYDGLLVEEDVTEPVGKVESKVDGWVERAHQLLEEPEPQKDVGTQCSDPYDCAFYAYCEPTLGRYPVTGLGGNGQKAFDRMHSGLIDIRDVPEDDLTPKQKRIQRVTASGTPELLPGAAEFEASLPYPRYYLDFETARFAVPIWAGTRPYEQLPSQWSCHVEDSPSALRHVDFVDLSGEPPMRRVAETLIDALGTEGPILVYSRFEASILNDLITRYPDLARELQAVIDRLVDLLPVVRENYYHPDMLGSWSIKAVIPTLAPDLNYGSLDDVHDGLEAQTAYLEAISPDTPPDRKEALRGSLLEYCRYDTLAMVRLVECFRGG